jgi:hypothetical protein
MKKAIFTALALAMLVGVAVVLPLSSAHALSTHLARTETRLYKPDKSYNGYFMPANTGGFTAYLMDLWGNVVHSWDVKGGASILHPDGTVWSIGVIQDWDGNVLWDFVPTRDAPSHATFVMHHDANRIWNNKLKQWTMLINCNRAMTQAEAVAMGMDPGVTYGSRINGIDFVIEVNMAKQIVWEWHPWEHGCQSKNSAWQNYVSNVKDAPGRLDVNWLTDNQQPKGTAGTMSDWFHVNSIDYNEDLDHVVINQKHWSQVIVVDHGKTFVSTTDFSANIAKAAGPDGDIIYRWGAPASYNAGESPGFLYEGDNQMYGSHDIQWIRPYHWERPHLATDTWPDPAAYPYGYTKASAALPGYGDFLIFDNGCYNPTRTGSRVREWNGRIDASGGMVPAGQYVWPHVAGYNRGKPITGNYQRKYSNQLIWNYQSSGMQSFYSSHISGCQRLPNGNTSINSGNQGLMFEVTPGTCTWSTSGTWNCTGQEVVWEYMYPGVGAQIKYVGSDSNNVWQTDDSKYRGTPSIYRHYRYGADHPAFIGRDLTPQGTLTGRIPSLVGSTDTWPAPTPLKGFGFDSFGTAAAVTTTTAAETAAGGAGAGAGGAGGGGGY